MSLTRALEAWFTQPRCEVLGDGHIHDTYLVREDAEASSERYVLQRVNEVVFTDGDLVMAQTARLLAQWSSQSEYRVPRLVPSRAGHQTERIDGELWRVWGYIEDTTVVDPLRHPSQARVAAMAFARLQVCVQDLALESFADPIPGFLQLDHYLRAFDKACAQARAETGALSQALMNAVVSHRHLAGCFEERSSLIHGDCKLNNLLYDSKQERVVAIIDFDTAMRGHWAWDFGDLVRSVCFSAGGLALPIYQACVEGFAAVQPLTNAQDCAIAPRYVTFMLGLRFLTDHIEGDRYFRVATRGENLRRAEEQFALLEAFDAGETQMLDIAQRALE